ncbi:MAG TPA: beta-N-acetylglucosaminidase domain-containing protein [Candidatus Binatia bacterium]|jgi:hyaluronoglucosaminidase
MALTPEFSRRGVVEGFFGPLWTMSQRAALFEFGAARGMNTYLYAPKDDPYHRERWTEPYPARRWKALTGLIRRARDMNIDFAYGFHPGKGLRFSAAHPARVLLAKAQRFYEAGVRTFAVLFDDIPSLLEHARDRESFKNSLARAEATWIAKLLSQQPASWKDVEWWICPSYYTEDPLLARVFGAFEPDFLEILSESLPESVSCFWTGPHVVSPRITLRHIRSVVERLKRQLIIWDNYPVNDLSMRDELHIAPLRGRDPRLPKTAYGYLNNPLLQEQLAFIPLATCFDYAANPRAYDPEASWEKIIHERFGSRALPYWRAIRNFCELQTMRKKQQRKIVIAGAQRRSLRAAVAYLRENRRTKWGREIKSWRDSMDAFL